MISINSKMNSSYPIAFRGPLDGVITNTLRTLDINPMANAVGLDLVSMVGPRTYVDTRDRNKYAGAETFFREFTGTLIVCLSASYLAKGIAHVMNKLMLPQVKINPNSWFSDDSLRFLNHMWKKSKKTDSYVESILDSVTGRDGINIRNFNNVDWKNIEWIDEKRWENIKWDNIKYKNINNKIKSKESIINLISEVIVNKNISKSDKKHLIEILSLRITNALKADRISAGDGNLKVSSTVHNLLRDMTDLGKDVFINKNIDSAKAISKILKINRVKSIGALTIASVLGLFNQYINRKITEKRTGSKGFVGDVDFQNKVDSKSASKDTSKLFLFEKIAASIGMAAMAIGVMRVKSPKDFLKKLEFTGPVTSGNVIKTVYAATLIGRFMASQSKDELRETVTRDYLGFLNWLVFGGFAAKGVANLLDKDRKNLFNISKEGKGLKNWLNNMYLKSHNEIAARGKTFAKKNMWKMNIAHISGLVYSTVALGVLLPKLNIVIAKHNYKKQQKNLQNMDNSITFGSKINISDFIGMTNI